MVKYIHIALDDKIHARLVEIKGDRTWVVFLEGLTNDTEESYYK